MNVASGRASGKQLLLVACFCLIVLSQPAHADDGPNPERPARISTRVVRPLEGILTALLHESDESRSTMFLSLPARLSEARAGIGSEWFLASTPVGAFSGRIDLQAGMVAPRPVLTLYWYPSESIGVSVR